MATRIVNDRRRIGDGRAAGTTVPRRAAIAGLVADCAALLSLADSLERLAADLHKDRRAEDARALADGLSTGLARHLDEEAALLQAASRQGGGELDDVLDRARDEHRALRQLVDPVTEDLRAIGHAGLPAHPNRFVIETTVLCEFMRLHVKYKRETVYPLLSALEKGERTRAKSTTMRRTG